MIELPRAALKAGEIAETAEFFSFGTNDLTQTAFGISRDDAASFLGIYTAKGILPADPFVSIDRDGVGELIRIAAERGRKVRQESQARHLRRARRRSGFGRVLPRGRTRLRVVLAVPRADRAARRRAGGARQGRDGATDSWNRKFHRLTRRSWLMNSNILRANCSMHGTSRVTFGVTMIAAVAPRIRARVRAINAFATLTRQ